MFGRIRFTHISVLVVFLMLSAFVAVAQDGDAVPATTADTVVPGQEYRSVPISLDVQEAEIGTVLRSLATRSSARYITPVRTYDDLIKRASRRHGVPAALVKAVIHAESAFNPRAVSPKGAMGLMQLMPATAQQLGVAKPFHASQNVQGGTRYLRSLHERYGNWTHTLAAYNAGPTAVDHYRGVPPYTETRQYVKRVLSYYRRYHGDFP